MDLILDYGDFSIENIEEDTEGNKLYDLVLESSDNFISKLIRRTLETPLGYIKTATQVNNSIEYLDADYGNALYKKLSEPLTISFILEAKADIEQALQKLSDFPGLTIKAVNITNYSIDTLNIEVIYSYNNQSNISQVSLNL